MHTGINWPNSSHLHWNDKLLHQARLGIHVEISESHVRKVAYRPFVEQHLYADEVFSQRPGRTRDTFPNPWSEIRVLLTNEPRHLRSGCRLNEALLGSRGRSDAGPGAGVEGSVHSALPVRAENHVICVPGIGANKPFSVLVADRMPDLHFLEFGQCFPRCVYPGHGGIFHEAELFSNELERVENITDVALLAFRQQHANGRITKDSLFYYVYRVLHAPTNRERFPNDLAQALPRIPMAPDFDAAAEAGRELADLHLGCESGPEYSP